MFKERAIEFAKEHNIHKCFETSAKTGDNVEEVFSCAAREIFLQNEEKEDDSDGDDPKLKALPGQKKPSKDKKSEKFDLGKKP